MPEPKQLVVLHLIMDGVVNTGHARKERVAPLEGERWIEESAAAVCGASARDGTRCGSRAEVARPRGPGARIVQVRLVVNRHKGRVCTGRRGLGDPLRCVEGPIEDGCSARGSGRQVHAATDFATLGSVKVAQVPLKHDGVHAAQGTGEGEPTEERVLGSLSTARRDGEQW